MECNLVSPTTATTDRYDDISVKDHKRQRRTGEVSTIYHLTLNSPFPGCGVFLKDKDKR